MEPRIADVLTRDRTKDARAGTRNLQNILAGSVSNAAAVRVPVLAVAGADDRLFPNVRAHAATCVASPEVTVARTPRTPHAVAFSGERRMFRDVLAAWLAENRL